MFGRDSEGNNPLKKPLLYGAICFVVAIGATGAYYTFFVPHDPIPKNIRSQVNFSLYYPKTLPQNWILDKSSFYTDASSQVVGYLLRGPHGNLNITIQPVPKTFNFTDFYTKRLSNTVQFLTPQGQGAIGKASNQLVGSLVTPSSWVLASPSSSGVTQADIQTALNNLQTASP
jgi:hypothetical protein